MFNTGFDWLIFRVYNYLENIFFHFVVIEGHFPIFHRWLRGEVQAWYQMTNTSLNSKRPHCQDLKTARSCRAKDKWERRMKIKVKLNYCNKHTHKTRFAVDVLVTTKVRVITVRTRLLSASILHVWVREMKRLPAYNGGWQTPTRKRNVRVTTQNASLKS